MPKAHRGKTLNPTPSKGRGTCPVCGSTRIKILYEITGDDANFLRFHGTFNTIPSGGAPTYTFTGYPSPASIYRFPQANDPANDTSRQAKIGSHNGYNYYFGVDQNAPSPATEYQERIVRYLLVRMASKVEFI